ncbi:acyl-CoA synthetase [Sedimentimonas flavescens]|uniref:Acyl-CoA synthetase n=1 Tax=Sedimentimonas flavescens TaxID=2851012 RepID=A0ABT3A268_9RHOB|nr:acyl-CoA synthetase [Sedimentimonas flavescens]MCV2880015.1 acyl-CoA synthetase [Sedimentimonas flavescens]
MKHNIYEIGLDQNAANYVPLTPVSFMARTAAVYPNRTAVVYNDIRRTWAETYARCRRLASALSARGIGRGDTVSIIAANIPEIYEAHFAVPMAGAVLNAINTRLDAEAISFILSHAETKVFLVDPEFAEVAERALHIAGRSDILVVDILDASYEGGRRIGHITYDEMVAEGSESFEWTPPASEWDAISLNYTSGTTGNPKGVVYHYRGAHLNSLSNIATWQMGDTPVYLWTLPMFHCNGWCYPWTIAAAAGTVICLRAVRDEAMLRLMKEEGVTHFCGASIVLALIVHADAALKEGLQTGIKVLTGGAPPPAIIIEKMEAMGFEVTHAYGLTETYGPAVTCAWHPEWDAQSPAERARLKARQGVRNLSAEGLMVADPETLQPVPSDGQTIGEIFLRGNSVMKGYLKNPSATDEAFSGGWFASGDLGVMHSDGYVELKDRSKDIIISGGENISSIEVEDVLYKHPEVMEAAVVARPHERWGETPCAFVKLSAGATVSEAELIAFCRQNMAHFKAPKTVIFCELPKTSTGKVQKFALRERARELEMQG